MNTHQIIIVLLCILMVGACSKSESVQNPPQELTIYSEHIDWNKSNSIDMGKGDGPLYLQLQSTLLPTDDQILIYAADYKGNVTAVSLDDRAERLWRNRPDDIAVTGGVGVGSNVVLVGTQKGEVVALDQTSGEELWRTYLSSEILSPPQSANNIVVALTEDSRVYGLDAQTGAMLWTYKHTAPLLQLRGSAPVIINAGVVYVGFANGFVCALDLKTGGLLWQQAVSYPRGRSEIDRVVDVNGHMAIDDDVLFVVNYQGRVIAMDLRSQQLLWEKEFSSYKGLDVNQQAVFITDDESKVWALDKRNGDTLWQQGDLLYRELTAPTVFKDMVAVGDYDGYMHLLLASNGQLLGRIRADSDPIHTPPITLGDDLFVLTSDGDLVRFTPERIL